MTDKQFQKILKSLKAFGTVKWNTRGKQVYATVTTTNNAVYVGVGDTKEDAVEDLLRQLNDRKKQRREI